MAVVLFSKDVLICPTLVTILELLHVLRKRNLDYSILSVLELSSFATTEGYDTGKYHLGMPVQ